MALDATSWMLSPFVCGRTLCCLLRCRLTQPFPFHWSITSQPHSPAISPCFIHSSSLHLSTKHPSGSGSRQMGALSTSLWPQSAVTQLGDYWKWLLILLEKHMGSVGKGGGPEGAFPLCAGVRDVLFPLTCLVSLMCCPLFCPFTQRCEPSTSLCLSPTMLPLSLPMTLPTPTCLRL